MLTLNSNILKIGNKWILPVHSGGIVPPEPTVYQVTTSATHGTVTASPTEGTTGTEVTLSNTPDTHYHFGSYSLTGATLKNANQFDIADSDVSVVGNFIEDTKYTVTCTNDGHGTISASPSSNYTGSTITLSNTPNTGYEFDKYTLVSGTGASISGNILTIGTSNVTVRGDFSQGYSFYQLEIDVPINGSWVSLCGANVRPYMGRIRNGSNYDSLTTADLDKIADTTPGNEYTKFINNSNISPGYLLLYFYGPLPNGELTWYDSLGSTVKSGRYTTAILSGAVDGGGYAALSQTGAITLTAGAQRVLHK